MFEDLRRSKEEHHFQQKERELIAKLREKADAEKRERERRHQKELHWMKCPKCGQAMKEVEMGPVMADKCECGGIYFDAGELDILLAVDREESLFGRLFRRKANPER